MAVGSASTSGSNRDTASGTVAEFSLPNSGTDGVDERDNINGVPIESAEPDTPRLNRHGKPDGRFKRRDGSASGGNTGRNNTRSEKADRERLPALDITAGAIKGCHDLAAVLLRVEELEFEDTEAEKIARALIALGKYYPNVDVPGKFIAWMNLGTACATVYAPKVKTYQMRKANEKRAKAAQARGAGGPTVIHTAQGPVTANG